MKKLTNSILLLSIALLGTTNLKADTFEISFRNRSKQILTTSVCATHSRKTKFLNIGDKATAGLAELAEDGGTSNFVSELRNLDFINSIKSGSFLQPSKTDKITISARRRARNLTCVFGMMVSTNDGFPAISGFRLPRKVGRRRRFRARAYDAGSEVNTESCEHIPGPPCDAHFIGTPENGVIGKHEGIKGGADIDPARYGWTGPVVVGTVRRIK